MGSRLDPQLARQLAVIDRLGFGPELTAVMKDRAIRTWQVNNGQDNEMFGIDDYPWRRDVQPEQAAA